MFSEQRLRAALFYFSLLVFLIGLPIILSFALSYKFNPHTLRFTKTGLVSLKTQPSGAIIRLGNRLLKEATPATIHELLPGDYVVRIALENYYPWLGAVRVEAGKVTRLEKIILFPLRPNIKQLNKERVTSFWVDNKRGTIYYLDLAQKALYKSDLEGEDFKEIGKLPESFYAIKGFKVSPDREKLVCFNPHQIAVVYLEPQEKISYIRPLVELDYAESKIIDVFWHSDSFHLIAVTNKNIEAREAKAGSAPVNLANLSQRDTTSFYDENTDALYFTDYQKAADGKVYENIYKLDLMNKVFALRELIKPRADERDE